MIIRLNSKVLVEQNDINFIDTIFFVAICKLFFVIVLVYNMTQIVIII